MQKTSTFLMFTGDTYGKAEESINFYTSLLPNSEIKNIERWKQGESGGSEGLVKLAVFTLDNQEYMASENSMKHKFTFTPAISIYVNCESDDELNDLFAKLSSSGQIMMPVDNYGFSRLFGWISDKYGVSWQLNLAD